MQYAVRANVGRAVSTETRRQALRPSTGRPPAFLIGFMNPSNASNPASLGLYRSLWHFSTGARVAMSAGVALLVASQALRLALPWFVGQAVDALQTGGEAGLATAATWVGVLLVTAIVVWALHGPGRVLERSVGVHVRRRVTHALFDKLANAPQRWHDKHTASDLSQRMGQASGALDAFTQNQYVVVQGLLTFVGTLAALIVFAPLAGAVAIVAYAALLLVGTRFDRAMMRLATRENDAERRFASGLLEFVSGIVTFKALRLTPRAKRETDARLKAVFVPLSQSIRLNEAKWAYVDLLSTALTWGVVGLYVWQAHRAGPAILIGSVFVIYKYAEQAAAVVSSAASHFQTFAHFRVNAASADVIWNAPSRTEDVVALDDDWATLELRGLCFSHDPAHVDGKGIAHVDLSIARGERIALVGPSGSGKSTLMRVLAGLYDADQGRLAVDGVAHLSTEPLASISTFVPQDADVFEATVLDNLAAEGADRATLARAIAASAFDAVLATLPEGLATPIAERGVNLSGGQRQRLALARGLLAARDSSLVLLDEPTSALDPLTEAHVYRALRAYLPDAAIVASVHRMSLLEHFDRVVLMDDGRVVDSGSVDALRARQPLFAAMTANVQNERVAA